MHQSRWLWTRPWILASCAFAALLTPFSASLWQLLLLCAACLLVLAGSLRCSGLMPWRTLCLAVLLGCGWGLLQGLLALREALPPECEGVELWLEGAIWDLPESVPASYPNGAAEISRWKFRVSTVRDLSAQHCQWSGGLIQIYWDELLSAEPGQHWRLRARLRRPVYPLNPGAGDREASMLHQGIRATASAKVNYAHVLAQSSSLRLVYQRLRWAFLQRLDRAEMPQWQRAVIRALTIGDRAELSDHVKQLLRGLGLSHLLVVSGLHIGMVAAWAWLVGGFLGRALSIAGLYWPAQYLSAAAAMAVSTGYAALAGFAIPTQRALVAVAAASLLRLSGGGFSPWQLLLLGLLSVALIEPFAALSAGFWLSFAAVACILWLRQWQPGLRGWRFVVSMQCLLCLALAPLSAFWFGEFSWVAPMVNLIAVPVVGFWMVPLCLLAVVATVLAGDAAAAALWRLAVLPLTWVQQLSEQDGLGLLTSVQPLSLALSPVVLSVLGLSGLLIAAPLGRLRWCLVVVLALPAACKPRPLEPGVARLTVLDVGQATAVVWQERGYTLVYDVGGGDPLGANAARSSLLPYLRHRGVSDIDDLVISHADRDHVAGLATVLNALPVRRLRGENLPVSAPATPCRAGQSWRSEAAVLRFMAPAGAEPGSRNDRSCVLLIEYGEFRVLLPGDIGRERELELLRYWREDLRADWLLAAHHGSRSSSSVTWIKWVEPKHVVFSAGYRSRFGHPHPSVIQRFAAVGAQHYNTAELGALTFTLRDGALQDVRAERWDRARFWRF